MDTPETTFAREFLPNEAGCPQFINADLIAAAPELLGALVELVQSAEYIYRSHGNEISGTFKLWQDIVRAQSAINKAKGIK